MRAMALILAVLVLGAAGALRAETVDDIITLAQRDVGDDVLLATVAKSSQPFNLSAAQVLQLKENKVSDRVIAAMIRHKPSAEAAATVPAAPQNRAVAPAAPLAPATPPVAGPRRDGIRPVDNAEGTLTIENLDERVWSYRFEPETQTLWFSTAAADGQGNLAAHGGINLRMPAGTLKIRYNGRESGQSVTIHPGEKSLVMLSRVATDESEALYVSVFEKGERKASGQLAVLRDRAAQPQREERAEVERPVRERVIEERIVEAPRTTVIYREPAVIYTPPPAVIYHGPVYHPGYYYRPYNSFNFGYSRHGRRSGWGVGFGVGF